MAEYGYSSGALGARGTGSARGGDRDAGISGGGVAGAHCVPRSSGPAPARSWGSCTALGPFSPRSGAGGGGARFFFDPVFEDEPRHFLDACFLCQKPLGPNRDIYMYRGDTPFCSEECRQEQIEMDEAREKSRSLPMKAATSRKEQQKEKAPQGIQVRAGGAVVAV